MRYSFDLKQTIIRLLSKFDRRVQRIEWLYALLFPVEDLYDRFRSFVTDINASTAMTGQVIYLEHLLNDRFDRNQRRIFIDDGVYESSTYLFFEAEGIREPYTYFEAEVDPQEDYLVDHSSALDNVDFYINMPTGIYWFTGYLESLVNPLKLAGKTYATRGI